MMQPETKWVASLLNKDPKDNQTLARAAAAFGWRVAAVNGLHELDRLTARRPVEAILFDPVELSRKALSIEDLAKVAPGARPIACSGPCASCAEPVASAYSTLMLPLAERELHQTLGFIWAAVCAPDASTWLDAPQLVGYAA